MQVAKDSWNPEQYNRFQDLRSQPFFDLVNLIEREPDMEIVDLGCGDGRLTGQLHQILEARQTSGLDSSASMLAETPKAFGLEFHNRSIQEFLDSDSSLNLLFSNAALQWVEDHPTLWPRLCQRVDPGGQLAIQMPGNHHHPYHAAARQVAGEAPFREALQGYVRISPVLGIADYSLLLYQAGFQKQSVTMKIYLHILESRNSIVDWARGTLLTDYKKRLNAEMYQQFEDRYATVIDESFPDQRPFPLPFERILMWARR